MGFWTFLLYSVTVQAAGLPTINLRYTVRPPFMVEEKNSISGDFGSPTLKAFADAQVPVKLLNTPINRQKQLISTNQGHDCGLGWFKNPEREKFAKFSEAIFQDPPWAVIMSRRAKKIPEKTLKDLLARRDLIFLKKENYSYGAKIDEIIKQKNPQTYLATGSSKQMLQMIHFGRGDYMFMTQREAEYLITSLSLHKRDFRFLFFSDTPLGEKRYLMCSQNVPDQALKRFNKAIKKLNSRKDKAAFVFGSKSWA